MAGKNPAVNPNIDAAQRAGERNAPVPKLAVNIYNDQRARDIKYLVTATGKSGETNLTYSQKQALLEQYRPSQKAQNWEKVWTTLPQSRRDHILNTEGKKVNLFDNSWATFSPQVRSTALKRATVATGNTNFKWSDAFVRNPDMALAASSALNEGSVNAKQIETINAAIELLDSIDYIGRSVSQVEREKFISKLSESQRVSMAVLSDELVKEFDKKLVEARKSGDNFLINGLQETFGVVAEAFMWLNEQGVHAGRAAIKSRTDGLNPIDAWNQTATGTIDEDVLLSLKAEYGDKKTSVIYDALLHAGDEDAFTNLIVKYENDAEAIGYIEEFIFDYRRDESTQKLIQEISNSTNDDLGNLVANLIPDMLPESLKEKLPDAFKKGGAAWKTTDVAANLAGTFYLDPTLGLGKAFRAYKLMRYGLIKNVGRGAGGSLASLMAMPKTRRVLDGVAKYADEYNAAGFAGKTDTEAAIRRNFERDFGRIIHTDAFDSVAYHFRQPEVAALGSTEEKMMSWLESNEALGRLAQGSPIILGKQLAPRMSALRAKYIEARFNKNKIIDFSKKDKTFLGVLLNDPNNAAAIKLSMGLKPSDSLEKLAENPDVAKLLIEKKIDNVIDAMRNPDFRNKIAAQFDLDPSQISIVEGKVKYNGKRNLLKVDRWTRLLERAPMGRVIYTADNRDAKKVYAWARAFFTKDIAYEYEQIWRRANQGQKRALLAGMFDTMAAMRGITKEINPEAYNKLMTSSLREGEQYASSFTLSAVDKANEVTKAGTYNPSVVKTNGRERSHALHDSQLADAVAVPSFIDFEEAALRLGVLTKIAGKVNSKGFTAFVNWWSTWNLAGPRYVQRAAFEDHAGYFLTGGSLQNYVSGKELALALREARGESTGILGETQRKAGNKLANLIVADNSFVGKIVKQHLPEEKVAQANAALKQGRKKEFINLAVESLARYQFSFNLGKKFSNAKINKLESEALEAFAALGDEGLSLLDDVRELQGLDIVATRENVVVGGGRKSWGSKQTPILEKNFTDIGFAEHPLQAYRWWNAGLYNVLHTDGIRGQIVYRALSSSKSLEAARKKAVKLITREIENGAIDKKRFTMFTEENVTAQEFADRYFDAASHYFLIGEDRVINRELLAKVATREDGELVGKTFTKADGETVNLVDPTSLRELGDKHPSVVLGRKDTLQGYRDATTNTERMWHMMSDSLARVSREPIFFARYIGEYKALQPYKQTLLDNGLSEMSARKIVRDIAVRQAELLSLSYMDNPAIRSIGAVKARNIARYYRATEDFYRRVARIVKYNPEAIQKLNLSISMLDETGYIWTDENGEQYFVYPGNEVLHGAIKRVTDTFGMSMMTENPFTVTGKVFMLTPSADPSSWMPTLSSPIAAVPIKAFVSLTGFDSLEYWTLGQRSAEQPDTDLLNEMFEAIVPGHIKRVLQSLTRDERSTAYANSIRSAIQILAYNGDVSADDLKTQAQESEYRNRLENTAMSVLGTRALLGFILPASPQITQDAKGLTDEGRSLGINEFRPQFLKLVDKFGGDTERALALWCKLNPDLFPFSVSGTETASVTSPPMLEKSLKWMDNNKDIVEQYPDAAFFFAPNGGDFSPTAYNLAKANGWIKSKSYDQYIKDILVAQDRFKYYQNKDDYDATLLTASPYERKQYEELWRQYKTQMFAKNPYLEDSLMSSLGNQKKRLKQSALESVRAVVALWEEGKVKSPNAAILSSMQKTFDDAMTELSKYSGSSTYEEDMRSDIRATLRSLLIERAGDNVAGKKFYRDVLDDLIG